MFFSIKPLSIKGQDTLIPSRNFTIITDTITKTDTIFVIDTIINSYTYIVTDTIFDISNFNEEKKEDSIYHKFEGH